MDKILGGLRKKTSRDYSKSPTPKSRSATLHKDFAPSQKEKPFQICFAGPSSVGKSAIIQKKMDKTKNIENQDPSPTVEDFTHLKIELESHSISTTILDTSGDSHYNNLHKKWWEWGDSFVVVFSLLSKASMKQASQFVAEICKTRNSLKKSTLMIIVGNFCDSSNLQITKEEAEFFAKGLNCSYFEVSAKTGQGIDEIFEFLLSKGIRKFKGRLESWKNASITSVDLINSMNEKNFNSQLKNEQISQNSPHKNIEKRISQQGYSYSNPSKNSPMKNSGTTNLNDLSNSKNNSLDSTLSVEEHEERKKTERKTLHEIEKDLEKYQTKIEELTEEFEEARKLSRDFKADQTSREKHSNRAEKIGPQISELSIQIRQLELIKKTQEIKVRSTEQQIPILGLNQSQNANNQTESLRPQVPPKPDHLQVKNAPKSDHLQLKNAPKHSSHHYLEKIKELTKEHAQAQLKNTNLLLSSTATQKEITQNEEKLEQVREAIIKAKRKYRDAISVEFRPEQWIPYLEQIHLAQKIIKQFLARKRFQTLKRQNIQRLKIAQEILFTEVTYQQNLKEIIEIYSKPLKAKAKNNQTIIPLEHLKEIFDPSLEVIISTSQIFLRKFDEKIGKWYPNQRLGDVFEQSLIPILPIYISWVTNYDKALDTLSKYSRSPEFYEFLEKSELVPDHLESLLIQPIQRVPRYELLLKELVKNTWDFHPDYSTLTEVVEKIKEKADKINEKKRNAENIQIVYQIGSNLIGKHPPIVDPQRRFILESDAIVIQATKKKLERHLFLFNDIILVTKREHKRKYEFVEIFSLSEAAVINQSNSEDITNAFEILGNKSTLWIMMDDLPSKKKWIKTLNDVVDILNERAQSLKERTEKQATNKAKQAKALIGERYAVIKSGGSPANNKFRNRAATTSFDSKIKTFHSMTAVDRFALTKEAEENLSILKGQQNNNQNNQKLNNLRDIKVSQSLNLPSQAKGDFLRELSEKSQSFKTRSSTGTSGVKFLPVKANPPPRNRLVPPITTTKSENNDTNQNIDHSKNQHEISPKPQLSRSISNPTGCSAIPTQSQQEHPSSPKKCSATPPQSQQEHPSSPKKTPPQVKAKPPSLTKKKG